MSRLMISFQTEHPIALKIIDARTAPIDFVRRFLPRELEISRLINHENLLRVITDFESSKKYYIVTELARFDLLQYLRLKGNLTLELFTENCFRSPERKSGKETFLRANQWNQPLAYEQYCASRYKM